MPTISEGKRLNFCFWLKGFGFLLCLGDNSSLPSFGCDCINPFLFIYIQYCWIFEWVVILFSASLKLSLYPGPLQSLLNGIGPIYFSFVSCVRNFISGCMFLWKMDKHFSLDKNNYLQLSSNSLYFSNNQAWTSWADQILCSHNIIKDFRGFWRFDGKPHLIV